MSLTFPSYVDSSMLSTWRSCKRKHFWSTINALYPTGQSVHLIAGAAIANAMEAVRNYCFRAGDANTSLERLLEIAYTPFMETWGDYEAPEKHAKSFENTWAALVFYLENHHPLTDPIQPYIRPDGSPAVEYTFAIPLDILHPDTNEPIFFAGRFDMLGVYNLEHSVIPVVVDEKSTGAFSFTWSDQWDLRGQFIGYTWAARSAGIDVRHAAVRGIAIQKTQSQVRTAFIEYPLHRIEQWHRLMLSDIHEMVMAYEHLRKLGKDEFSLEAFYPFNFADACNSYGGCAFQTLCATRNPEPFFSNYIKHRFNPIAKQPVEELESA